LNPLGDYFNFRVDSEHETGDIWVNIPTFGLLPHKVGPGIVITPACDLSNGKVETATLLPVVTLAQYLGSSAFTQQAVGELNGLLSKASLQTTSLSEVLGDTCTSVHEVLVAAISALQPSDLTQRLHAGLRVVFGTPPDDSTTDARALFGEKGYHKLVEAIARNASRPEIHFIPSDRYPRELSAIEAHSVTLFRYPITVPIAILDSAQDLEQTDWRLSCDRLVSRYRIASEFSTFRPEKRARIRERYMADIITRYLAVYLRLGSPDFPQNVLQSIVDELK
jgi:hypothetical protein